MKHRCFLAVALAVSTAFSQDIPWPMPSPLPQPTTPGETTKPTPRIEWLQQVQSFFEDAHKKADSIRLIFDGDSITRAWIGTGGTIWAERYAKRGAFDFAVGGDGTQHVLWRLSQGQVAGLHPKLVVLLIGTNNIRASTPTQVADGVRTVVAEYRKRCPESAILVQGIFPRGEKPTDPLRETIRQINQLLAGLDDGQNVIFRDFGEKFLEADGTLSKDIMPDFLHLSLKGYQIWAEAIQPIIDQYVPENPVTVEPPAASSSIP